MEQRSESSPASPPLDRPSVPPATAGADLSVIVVRARSAWQGISLAELWQYRELVFFLIWRDIKVRYKQTVLGVAWAVLQPVTATAIFAVLFGRWARIADQVDAPYPLLVYAAVLPWTFFSDAVGQSSQSLVASANLLTKIYFPRWIIPWSAVGGLLLDFAISAVIMFGMLAWYQVPLGLHVLWLPVMIVLTLLAVLGTGSLLSALTVTYRDFRYLVPFLLQIWMFVSPVAYPLQVVPTEWRNLYALNPMAGIIEGYRHALLGGEAPWPVIGISALSALVLFLAGAAYFLRVERTFADRI